MNAASRSECYTSRKVLVKLRRNHEGKRDPELRKTIISDDSLRKALSKLHAILDTRSSVLERESLFLSAAAKILECAVSWKNVLQDIPAPLALSAGARLSAGITSSRTYRWDRLASVAGLSKFHLLRQFRAEFGLPPHSYPIPAADQLRAKSLLKMLEPVEVAMTCGFADQSHFHRVFPVARGNNSWLLCGAISFKTPDLNIHTLHVRRCRDGFQVQEEETMSTRVWLPDQETATLPADYLSQSRAQLKSWLLTEEHQPDRRSLSRYHHLLLSTRRDLRCLDSTGVADPGSEIWSRPIPTISSSRCTGSS